MAGSWKVGCDRGRDNSRELSSFDGLGALPTFPNTTIFGAEPNCQPHYAYGVDVEGLASAGRHRWRTNPTKNRSLGYAAGTGCSTESGLEQALERASVSFDSDEELEAIRGSVRSLRAQRAAVEKLKEKARREEGTSEVLRRKLGEAENRIRELRAQGGRDVVRRLMDEVTELRARLKATSTAFQTRENSVAELREAVQQLRRDMLAEQEKSRAQSRKLQEQGRESQELLATISRLEDTCARCEERAQAAEKTAEEKCAASGRELASLSALLREANATIDASKGNTQATLAKQKAKLEAAHKEKESLLFQKGKAQERMQELTFLCERQQSELVEAARRARELQRLASAAKKNAKLAEDQAGKLRAELSMAHQSRREEDAGATIKLRTAARQAEELKAELAAAKSEAVDKADQLVKCRDEMSKFHADVSKLRDAAAQLGDTRKVVRDRDQTIKDLTRRLELERRERGQWGQARKQLLLEFCEEENKLRSTLQPASHEDQPPPKTRPRRRKQRQQQPQQQPQRPSTVGLSPSVRSDGSHSRDHESLSRHSARCSIHSSGDLNGGRRADDSLMDYSSYLGRGKEEKTDRDSEGDAPHNGQGWREEGRTGVESHRKFGFGGVSGLRHGENRTTGLDEFERRSGRRICQRA